MCFQVFLWEEVFTVFSRKIAKSKFREILSCFCELQKLISKRKRANQCENASSVKKRCKIKKKFLPTKKNSNNKVWVICQVALLIFVKI